MQNLGNVHQKMTKLQVMAGNRKGAFNTMLLHLRLTCITFTKGGKGVSGINIISDMISLQ